MAKEDTKKIVASINSEFNDSGFNQASKAADKFKKKMEGISKPFGDFSKSLREMSASIRMINQAVNKMSSSMDNLKKAEEKLDEVFKKQQKQAKSGGAAKFSSFKIGLTKQAGKKFDYSAGLKAFDEDLQGIFSRIQEDLKNINEEDLFGGAKASFQNLRDIVNNIDEALKNSRFDVIEEQLLEYEKALNEVNKRASEGVEGYQDLKDSLESLKDPSNDLVVIFKDLNSAMRDLESVSKKYSVFTKEGLKAREKYREQQEEFAKAQGKSPFIARMFADMRTEKKFGKTGFGGKVFGKMAGSRFRAVSKIGQAGAMVSSMGLKKSIAMLTKLHPVIAKISIAVGALTAGVKAYNKAMKEVFEIKGGMQDLHAASGNLTGSFRDTRDAILTAIDTLNDHAFDLKLTKKESLELGSTLTQLGFKFEEVFKKGSKVFETSVVAASTLGMSLGDAANMVSEFQFTFGKNMDETLVEIARLRNDAGKTKLTTKLFKDDVLELSKSLVKYNMNIERVSESYKRFQNLVDLPMNLSREFGKAFIKTTQEWDAGMKHFMATALPRDTWITAVDEQLERLHENARKGILTGMDEQKMEKLEKLQKQLKSGATIDINMSSALMELAGSTDTMFRAISNRLKQVAPNVDIEVGNVFLREIMKSFGFGPEMEHAYVAGIKRTRQIERLENMKKALEEEKAIALKNGTWLKEQQDALDGVNAALERANGEADKLRKDMIKSATKALVVEAKRRRQNKMSIFDAASEALDGWWLRAKASFDSWFDAVVGANSGDVTAARSINEAASLKGDLLAKEAEIKEDANAIKSVIEDFERRMETKSLNDEELKQYELLKGELGKLNNSLAELEKLRSKAEELTSVSLEDVSDDLDDYREKVSDLFKDSAKYLKDAAKDQFEASKELKSSAEERHSRVKQLAEEYGKIVEASKAGAKSKYARMEKIGPKAVNEYIKNISENLINKSKRGALGAEDMGLVKFLNELKAQGKLGNEQLLKVAELNTNLLNRAKNMSTKDLRSFVVDVMNKGEKATKFEKTLANKYRAELEKRLGGPVNLSNYVNQDREYVANKLLESGRINEEEVGAFKQMEDYIRSANASQLEGMDKVKREAAIETTLNIAIGGVTEDELEKLRKIWGDLALDNAEIIRKILRDEGISAKNSNYTR